MTYQVVSNSNPSLFDSVSINSTTGNLVLNAAASQSGRSIITVKATDAAGLTTTAAFSADVNYTNQAPILDFVPDYDGSDTWTIYGTVTDDQVVRGMIVYFTGDVFTLRATVEEDGTFEFAVIVNPADWDIEWAYTIDSQGLESALAFDYIDIT
jgi:hypothetical protein